MSTKNYKNRGQQLLVNSGLSNAVVAEVYDCTRQAVHRWATGQSLPDPERRKAMGGMIPPAAWERAPRESLEIEDDEHLVLPDDFFTHSTPACRATALAAERLRTRLEKLGRYDLLPPRRNSAEWQS